MGLGGWWFVVLVYHYEWSLACRVACVNTKSMNRRKSYTEDTEGNTEGAEKSRIIERAGAAEAGGARQLLASGFGLRGETIRQIGTGQFVGVVMRQ